MASRRTVSESFSMQNYAPHLSPLKNLPGHMVYSVQELFVMVFQLRDRASWRYLGGVKGRKCMCACADMHVTEHDRVHV
jgi:hypothetical protein